MEIDYLKLLYNEREAKKMNSTIDQSVFFRTIHSCYHFLVKKGNMSLGGAVVGEICNDVQSNSGSTQS